MSKLPVFATCICVLGGVAAGYFLIPGPTEQLTMLVRDGREETALDQANVLFYAGNREPALLMQVFLLNQRAGETARAQVALRAYFKQNPDDATAWLKASEVLDEASNSELLTEALSNVVRLTKNPKAAGRLAGLLRLRGRLSEELQVLQAVDSKKLSDDDALQLATLLLGRHELNDAVTILERLDDGKPGLKTDGRIKLFGGLVDQGRFDESADRAIRWGKSDDSPALQDVFVGYLLRAGADGAALRLATQHEVVANVASITHLAQLFSSEGRPDLLDGLIAEWLTYAGELPSDQLDGYLEQVVRLARGKGLSGTLYNQLFLAFSKRDAFEVEASFLQAMYDEFGYAGVAPFRSALQMQPEIFSARPVFAARLLLVEHNQLLARHFLLTARLPDLSAKARYDWLAMAQTVMSPHELAYELGRRARAGSIPPEMNRDVLNIAMRGGSQPQMVALWESFFDVGRPIVMKARSARHRLD